ncbi:MAG: hypothetical protein WC004_01675, partial [Candidatus Absconditabacterales bacterium]
MKKMVFSYFNRYEQGPEARNSAKEVKVAEAKAEMADMQPKDIVAKARQLFDEAGGKLKTTDTKLVCYVQKVLEQSNYNTNVTTKLPMTNFVDGDRGRSSKFNLQEFYQLNTLDRTGTLTGEFFDKAESLATNQDPAIEATPATPDSTTLIQSVITLGLDKPQTVFAGVEGAKDKREGMNTKMKLLNFTAYAQDPTVVALTERGILKQPTSGMLILNNIYNSVLTFDENQDYT